MFSIIERTRSFKTEDSLRAGRRNGNVLLKTGVFDRSAARVIENGCLSSSSLRKVLPAVVSKTVSKTVHFDKTPTQSGLRVVILSVLPVLPNLLHFVILGLILLCQKP